MSEIRVLQKDAAEAEAYRHKLALERARAEERQCCDAVEAAYAEWGERAGPGRTLDPLFMRLWAGEIAKREDALAHASSSVTEANGLATSARDAFARRTAEERLAVRALRGAWRQYSRAREESRLNEASDAAALRRMIG